MRPADYRLLTAARVCVFDDMDPADWHAPLDHPAARELSMAELSSLRFADAFADTALAEQIAFAHACGVTYAEGPWGGFRGPNGLSVYVATSHNAFEGDVLLVAELGEFQPARYIATICAVWSMDAAR